ncbi:MAG: chemotaxis protein CheW [Rhodocyclaceae bacterium]
MTIDMSQFYQVFFEETAEHLAAMESLLLGLDLAAPDSEELNAIFRAAHSIKGSSGTFGFNDLAEVTHVLENLLDRIRKNELALRNDMVDAFLDAGDILKAMLAAHQGGAPVADGTVAQVCANLKALTTDADTTAPLAAMAVPASSPTPSPVQPGACFDIEFLPTVEATADHQAIPNLLQALSGMGQLDVVAQPEAGEPGLWCLRLLTGRPQAEFEDFLEFVSEKDAWRVKRTATDTVDAGGAYGLFDVAAAEADDDAYGLFESDQDTAAHSAMVADEGEGFGFFEPLPVTLDSPSALPAAATVLEGDGFGFFEPLPEPVAAFPVAPAAVSVTSPTESAAVAVVLPAAASPVARESRAKPATAPAGEAASIRVSVERADQLINLVGELVITQAMLLQCAAQMHDAAPEALTNGLAQLERNTRGLQEAIMSIRMMPISFVFSRFPRVVRDLSSKLGKQVELKMNGETTELDKGLIERIADPLTHLIRNSLDHGVELPETRIAAGKSPLGTITLKAAHQGGNIVIEVGDDGAGLDRQRILSKARERGFQVSDQMTDQEVWALIFEAGFSTAEVVTDVSGRGVGMDVVRRNIQAMGGRIEIESMSGVGTRMTVRLPLTLAILDGMSVAVGEHIYILPLSYVIESLQPERGDVKTLSNQTRVIQVRNEYLPVVSLHDMFRVPGAETDFTRGIMIVLDADGTKAALFVDALVGQHQVVIKSLEQNYRRVSGISGATIMGDGRVALILDVSALIELSRAAQAVAVPALV